PATAGIYTLSLHAALPISPRPGSRGAAEPGESQRQMSIHRSKTVCRRHAPDRPRRDSRGRGESESETLVVGALARLLNRHGAFGDRKSTRLNSSHDQISYA